MLANAETIPVLVLKLVARRVEMPAFVMGGSPVLEVTDIRQLMGSQSCVNGPAIDARMMSRVATARDYPTTEQLRVRDA